MRQLHTPTDRRSDLAGRVALVTGGGGGIGRVFAESLARAGATVAVSGRSRSRLDVTVDRIRSAGGHADAFAFDVTKEEDVREGLRDVQRTIGPIDVLVNNAGIGGPIDNLWVANPRDWWDTFQTNVRGPFLCAHAALPGMVSRGSGTIVNVVSNAGVLRWPLCSAYAVSKGALIKFSENLAAETRAHGVSVFAFHPGLLEVDLTESPLATGTPPESAEGRVAAWVRSEIQAGRAVSAETCGARLVELVSGCFADLSGCYLTVADDLELLLQRMRGSSNGGLYMLRLRR